MNDDAINDDEVSGEQLNDDEQWMARALELATRGAGSVSPNPLVGCVLVHQGRVIGEGWHQQYGQAHAEVNAVRAVDDPALLAQATAYVSLEPCAHHGRTPPCADLLVTHRLRRVVVCNHDPNPLVAGRGLAQLRAAGIAITTGVLADRGRHLNRRFFTSMEQQRPHVVLKWAATADGFVARPNFDSRWISNALARKLVHRWRAEEDAVLVGTRTAQYDDPRLNVRDWSGRNPTRMVVDRHRTLPPTLHLFDGSQPTLAYTLASDDAPTAQPWKATRAGGVAAEWVRLRPDAPLLPQLLADLTHRRIQSVLVEGGSQLLQSFIDADLWDEARVFTSPQAFGQGIAAPVLAGRCVACTDLLGDELRIYQPR